MCKNESSCYRCIPMINLHRNRERTLRFVPEATMLESDADLLAAKGRHGPSPVRNREYVCTTTFRVYYTYE
jgi:hypothetical protein